MLIKEFHPVGNLVLIESTHTISKFEIRGSDPSIPKAHTSRIVAIGNKCDPSLHVDQLVALTPEPYIMYPMFFTDNSKDPFKIKDAVLNEKLDVTTDKSTTVDIVTYHLHEERAIIGTLDRDQANFEQEQADFRTRLKHTPIVDLNKKNIKPLIRK